MILVDYLRLHMNQQTVLAAVGAFEAERDSTIVSLKVLLDALKVLNVAPGPIEAKIEEAERLQPFPSAKYALTGVLEVKDALVSLLVDSSSSITMTSIFRTRRS